MPVSIIHINGTSVSIAEKDINNDGNQEIIVTTSQGSVLCLDSSGTEIWSYSLDNNHPFDLCVYDINEDGFSEIIVARGDGVVTVINHDGSLLWDFLSPNQFPVIQVTAGKFQNGNYIFATCTDRFIYVLNSSGNLTKQESLQRHLGSRHAQCARCVDVDSDGFDEVIVSCSTGGTNCLKYNTASNNFTSYWYRQNTGISGRAYSPAEMFTGLMPAVGNVLLISNWAIQGSALQVFDAKTGDKVPGGYFFFGYDTYPTRYKSTIIYTGERDGDLSGYSLFLLFGCDIFIVNIKNTGEWGELSDFCPSKDRNKQLLSFSCLCSGVIPGTVYLGGTRSGSNTIYKLEIDSNWKEDLAGLSHVGSSKKLIDWVDNLSVSSPSFPARNRINSKKIQFIVAAGNPVTKSGVSGLATGAIVPLKNDFNFDWLEFQYAFAAGQNGWGDSWGFDLIEKKISGPPSMNLMPDTGLMDLIDHAESIGQPFWLIIGNNQKVFCSLDIVNFAASKCNHLKGFMVAENDWAYGWREENSYPFFLDYLLPVMSICKTYGKKLMMTEKSHFWNSILMLDEFKAFRDGTYKDVLVPSAEDSNQRAGEICFASRVGMLASGVCTEIGDKIIEDDCLWEGSIFGTEASYMSHSRIRTLVRAYIFGASILQIHVGWRDNSSAQTYNYLGRQILKTFLTLISKGYLSCPDVHDMEHLSKTGIRITSNPDELYLLEALQYVEWDAPSSPRNSNSLFENFGRWHTGSKTKDTHITKYIFGQEKISTGLIPTTPFGMVPVLPDEAPCNLQGFSFTDSFKTDGKDLIINEVRKNAIEAKDYIVSQLRLSKNNFLFTHGENDRVCMQVYKTGVNKHDIIIVDSNMENISDVSVSIEVNWSKFTRFNGLLVKDLLTNANQKVYTGSNINISVPPGGFTIMETEAFQEDTINKAGEPVRPAFKVGVFDKYGNLVKQNNVSVKLRALHNGNDFIAKGDTEKTTSNGIVEFDNIIFEKSGSFTIFCESDGLLRTEDSGVINIEPNIANSLKFISHPSTIKAGDQFLPRISVEIVDIYGNRVTSDNTTQVIIVFASNAGNPVLGSLIGTRVATAINGIATFNNLTINISGSGYSLRTRATGLIASDASSVFDVVAGDPVLLKLI